jgi:hypothetical protein
MLLEYDPYVLQIIPYKNTSFMYGCYYLLHTLVYDSGNINTVSQTGTNFTLIPTNSNIVVSEMLNLTENGYFRNTNDIDIVDDTGTNHTITAPILFDFRSQIISQSYELEFITITPKNYTINELPLAIKTAFQALANPIVMTSDGINNTYYDADGRMKFQTDVKIILKTHFTNIGYNPMAYVIGLRDSEEFIQQTHHMQTVPDLSGITSLYIHSKNITRDQNCLCGDETSTSVIGIIPITVDFNIYQFWASSYKDQYMRLYQMPQNLNQIDIQICDVMGNVLSLNSDTSLLFEVIHES